jgi:energy-coupling factor transport system substrate-specific component
MPRAPVKPAQASDERSTPLTERWGGRGELLAMWSNTRMVVFVAMSASLYAAILIPFKVIPLIPGITEVRPANAVPVVCSFLFGPAAGWGAAIGNAIGDTFGGLGPGDAFGLLGNFLYGIAPYRVWRALGGGRPVPRGAADWARYAVSVFAGAAACALVVGWGLNLLGFVPFPVLGNVVLLNNLIAAGILSPLVLSQVYPRVERAQLLFGDVIEQRRPGPLRARVGLTLAFCGIVGGLVAGNLAATGVWQPSWVDPSGSPTRAPEVGFGVAPFVALAAIGLLLL